MIPLKAAKFGRRAGAGASGSSGTFAAVIPLSKNAPGLDPDPDLRLAEFAKTLRAETQSAGSQAPRSGEGVVPWSMRAACLAGLCAALLQAGMVVASARGIVEIVPGFKLDVGEGSMLTPMIIVSGLWSGAQIAAEAVMASHFLLRALVRTGIADYAIAGGATGAAIAWISAQLSGNHHGVVAAAATGVATGLLYRLFAGLRPEPGF